MSLNMRISHCSGIQHSKHFLHFCVLIIAILTGCRTMLPDRDIKPEQSEQKTFSLEHINNERCIDFLSQLNLGSQFQTVPDTNEVIVNGSPEQLCRAAVVLGLIDQKEDFIIENLGPSSMVRALPSNSQIAKILGDVKIGTFSEPPENGGQARGIIDIHEDEVIAIVPARYQTQLWDILKQVYSKMDFSYTSLTANEDNNYHPDEDGLEVTNKSESSHSETGVLNQGNTFDDNVITRISSDEDQQVSLASQESYPEPVTLSVPEDNIVQDSRPKENIPETSLPATYTDNSDAPNSRTLKVIIKSAKNLGDNTETTHSSESVEFPNGEDIVDLALPETVTLAQLLGLVGEYLDLDYIYNPDIIGNQSIALKLNGKLKGEVKVKDLYALLETVLKFRGLAMIRGEGKLITIVPVGQALEVDPQLIDSKNKKVQAGDIVVTRIFELQYVDAGSVVSLLQNMKLGVTVSSSDQTQMLFVTCYAHRMGRIEQLVSMLDKPGKPKECWFRPLRYTIASEITDKVCSLALELQGIPILMASDSGKSSSQKGKGTSNSKTIQPVYMDTEERTNRIVMIGCEEQLTLLDELIEVLDIATEDMRIPHVYNIKNMKAQEALDKLLKMEVLGSSAVSDGKPRRGSSATQNGGLAEAPIVAVLEATNQLLIKATQEQHDQINEFLSHIDVSLENMRTLQVYEIKYVNAEEVKSKLEELGITGTGPATSLKITDTKSANSETDKPSTQNTVVVPTILMEKPQVVVNESNNTLLIRATSDQHTQIASIIKHLDSKMLEEEMPYKMYPLENSSPEHVANILTKLIQEAAGDLEDKIQKIPGKGERITIVPDPNTFSLIVYASKKNQEWIETLTKALDKRRPQVLIDVTLVEISRTDTFEYDLNLVANAKDAVIGNIGIDPLHTVDSMSHLEGSFNLLDSDGNPTGQTKAFYSDEKVQALLTAIQRKNYGRVLAKPKILVDDGQEGKISTTDETTYVKESIQIPEVGTPITTRDYMPIQASIRLIITPHISDGKLLRLDVQLSRDDFGTRPGEGAPPDKATSEVETTVFVPDDHTVILGGLVKLNQSKGGSKVPILGDIPLIGALFRSVDNSDTEKKLYVFLKANVVRPYEENKLADLQKISEEHRNAFEKSEAEFQGYEDIPGIKPQPMKPERVLDEL